LPESPLAIHASTPAELEARIAAARGGKPFVVFRHPTNGQVVLFLREPRLTIGRRQQCDIALPWDDRVSRLHGELLLVAGEWLVTDDGLSSNGTWVGDEKIQGRRRLRDGDLIRVGATVIAYCAPETSQDTLRTTNDDRLRPPVTPAQRRVLVALCRRFILDRNPTPPTNADLAADLFLSIDSVKTHLRALFEAFDLTEVPDRQKRTALIDRAVRAGVVSVRDAHAARRNLAS
jgi:pSer/pThr/pTyr-binding forkhead associated (FHA) protein